MRALKGRIPRAFTSHRTPEGAAYGAYCRGKLARLGPLPPDAMPILREAGIITVELPRIHREAGAPKLGRRDRARLRRQAIILRSQLVTLERHLQELARRNGHGNFDLAHELARQELQP